MSSDDGMDFDEIEKIVLSIVEKLSEFKDAIEKQSETDLLEGISLFRENFIFVSKIRSNLTSIGIKNGNYYDRVEDTFKILSSLIKLLTDRHNVIKPVVEHQLQLISDG